MGKHVSPVITGSAARGAGILPQDYDPNAEQECVVGGPAGERIGRDAANPPHDHLAEAPLT